MTPLVIVVEGEPVPWARPGQARSGARYTLRAQREFGELVAMMAKSVMKGFPPVDLQLELWVTSFFGIPASWTKAKVESALDGRFRMAGPDVDNLGKIVMDALQGVVYHNDRQIVALHTTKGFAKSPKLVVRIEPVIDRPNSHQPASPGQARPSHTKPSLPCRARTRPA